MRTHAVRAWSTYFEPVFDGSKPFEVRFDDRGYQAGDKIIMREWHVNKTCSCLLKHPAATCPRYTGRMVKARIGYVMASMPAEGSRKPFNGFGYVILGLVDVEAIPVPVMPPAQVATSASSGTSTTAAPIPTPGPTPAAVAHRVGSL